MIDAMPYIMLLLYVSSCAMLYAALRAKEKAEEAMAQARESMAKVEAEAAEIAAAFNRFVTLWNCGAKEEALRHLESHGLRTEAKA